MRPADRGGRRQRRRAGEGTALEGSGKKVRFRNGLFYYRPQVGGIRGKSTKWDDSLFTHCGAGTGVEPGPQRRRSERVRREARRHAGEAGPAVSWEVRGAAVAPVAVQPVAAGGSMSTWQLMLGIWPVEDRPEEMTRPEVVNSLTFDQLITYKNHYEALVKKEGKGDGVFGKDTDIPVKKYAAAEDNCADKLHPAR